MGRPEASTQAESQCRVAIEYALSRRFGLGCGIDLPLSCAEHDDVTVWERAKCPTQLILSLYLYIY